jgi:hypothetical protein
MWYSHFLKKDTILGRIDSAYLKYAQCAGADSSECMQLAEIFVTMVDFEQDNRLRPLEAGLGLLDLSSNTVWDVSKL